MPDQTEARWLARIGGSAAVLGALLGLVGNLIHPVTPGPGDPEGIMPRSSRPPTIRAHRGARRTSSSAAARS